MSAIAWNSVLVVDDNYSNIYAISEFLQESGFQVVSAEDGERGIELAEETRPDIILLDIVLPGIDGFETCKRLKAIPQTKDIPIIFTTSLTSPVDKIKGLNMGAVDYLAKPFQKEEVLARINIHLHLRNLTLQLQERNEKLEKLTEELEERVRERTAELSRSLARLQQAQVQLVQSEKMSSLGEMVAGIAHEINNPVGFVNGNLDLLQEQLPSLVNHLRLYRKNFPYPGEEIDLDAEEIEVEYLLEDLPDILKSMRVGVDRIAQISVSLRNFSRLDTNSKTLADIHAGIDSTLMILQHRLKANKQRPAINIIKDYGDLPEIYCYASMMNQVFMNLLANAIDAFDLMGETCPPEPSVWISTDILEGFGIAIRFADNGMGIPEQIKKQIFQPFVTTKPTGKGTGLGLSISRSIVVEKHGGGLECNSQPGEGTEFEIKIPLFDPSNC